MNFKVDLLVLISVVFTCVHCQRGSYAGNSGYISQRYQEAAMMQQQPNMMNIAPSPVNRIEQIRTPEVQLPNNIGFNNQPNDFANFFHQPGLVQPIQPGFAGFGFPALGRR
jgi:hypothetical protein